MSIRQYMYREAERQAGEAQKLDFEGRKRPLNLKKLLSAAGILLAVLLVLVILNQCGIL